MYIFVIFLTQQFRHPVIRWIEKKKKPLLKKWKRRIEMQRLIILRFICFSLFLIFLCILFPLLRSFLSDPLVFSFFLSFCPMTSHFPKKLWIQYFLQTKFSTHICHLLSECTGTLDLNSFDSDVAGSLGGQRKVNTARTLSLQLRHRMASKWITVVLWYMQVCMHRRYRNV